jgi:hypothetical protein
MTGSIPKKTVLPSDKEALKLALAFYCIMEPDKRATVLSLAERLARESAAVLSAAQLPGSIAGSDN